MSKSKKFVYKEGITKKHEVLKEAMKYLSKTRYTSDSHYYETFVCICICKVTGEKLLTNFKDKSGLIKIINERLNGHHTYDDWLIYEKGISVEDKNADEGRKIQYSRLCWMQSMYEEFLAKDE